MDIMGKLLAASGPNFADDYIYAGAKYSGAVLQPAIWSLAGGLVVVATAADEQIFCVSDDGNTFLSVPNGDGFQLYDRLGATIYDGTALSFVCAAPVMGTGQFNNLARNGNYVAGRILHNDGFLLHDRPAYWKRSDHSVVDMGDAGVNLDSKSYAISNDGGTIVGYASNPGNPVPFVYTGGVYTFPALPMGYDAGALISVSADGLFACGFAVNEAGGGNFNTNTGAVSGPCIAIIWQSGVGITALSDLAGFNIAVGRVVSSDATTAVTSPELSAELAKWTAGGGHVMLNLDASSAWAQITKDATAIVTNDDGTYDIAGTLHAPLYAYIGLDYATDYVYCVQTL